MGVGIVGWTTTEQFKAKNMKYIFLLIVCLIIPIIWGFPKPQFGDYGDEVVNETENEENPEDPIGNIFKDIISGFGLLMQDGINLITNVTQNNGDIGDAVEGAAKVGLGAASEAARIGLSVASTAPNILAQKVEFAQGLGKTLGDTSGLVKSAASSISDAASVVAAFAKTYSEMAIENLLGFANIFNKRLKCNTKCEGMEEGTEERTQCEKENCIEIEVPRDPKDLEDEYDYSYGYDYSDDDKDNEIGQDGIAPRNDS